MILAEKHNITKSNPIYAELDKLCFLSKNMYNVALYEFRKIYFSNINPNHNQKKVKISAFELLKDFTKNSQHDFISLPRKVSKESVFAAHQAFQSFFQLLKLKTKGLYNKNVSLPKYLKKDGRYIVCYDCQSFSRNPKNEGFVVLSGTNIRIKTNQLHKDIREIRIIPKGNYIVIDVLYSKQEQPIKPNNSRYAAIDIGVNNLATISSNCTTPLIINGKPLKSINQFSNKRIAELQAQLPKVQFTSRRIKAIYRIRHSKIQDYLHKASREVVNYLVSNDINTLIIGKNKEWKQNANLGSKNNQNFVQIPYARFIEMIDYKLKLLGLSCVINEESYTSKCSFLDFEPIEKRDEYCGKRIKRGLFKASNGKLINADLNGSLNILRKVVGNSAFANYPIEVASQPLVLTIKFN